MMGRWRRNVSDHEGSSSKSGRIISYNEILQRQRQRQQQEQEQEQQYQPSGSSIAANKHASCSAIDAADAPQSSLPSSPPPSNDARSAYTRLRQCVEEMRTAPLDADQVGLTYSRYYVNMREKCSRLCEKLASTCIYQGDSIGSGISTSSADAATERPSYSPWISTTGLVNGPLPSTRAESPTLPYPEISLPSPVKETTTTTTSSNSSSGRRRQGDGRPPPLSSKQQQQQLYIGIIRHWQGCQVALLEALRTSLLEAYQEADPSATVRGFEVLCANLRARRIAVRKIQQQQQQQHLNISLPPLFTEQHSVASPDDDGAAAAATAASSSPNGETLSGYEIRFANYDLVLADLAETRRLLQRATTLSGYGSGIPIPKQEHPADNVREYVISPRGNVVLEFVTDGTAAAAEQSTPVLRFRVSSHMLAEVSPVFARIFALYSGSGDPTNGGGGGAKAAASWHRSIDVNGAYYDEKFPPPPPPPTRHTCSDGTEVDLYRMVQAETNAHRALEIVLHAAHLHHEEVPRDVAFDQFVAIAWVCWRYRCTSPLELVVEHRWLPQWLHLSATTTLGGGFGSGTSTTAGADGDEDGDGNGRPPDDGLLIISYVFGVRRLFTRVTKSIILNLVDEHELYAKGWPAAVKKKILAVRQAKIDQVYACCSGALQEYLRPPRPPRPSVVSVPSSTDTTVGTSICTNYARGTVDSDMNGGGGNARASVFEPTSTPRCPRGSHACDAASLGWLMKTFAELQVLPHVLPSANVVGHLPPPPKRSLNQLFDALRL
ncbi:hypothetical protein SLS62_005480 [Diatrype stigma]|uniref:BTB domain-containing protein n=1 Tax=Diatrype stigma TaxID=117547 RepID=A0AAN9USJ0_9PEZI